MSTYQTNKIVRKSLRSTITLRQPSTVDLFDKVREWGQSKGITGKDGKGSVAGQIVKLEEEVRELEDGFLKDNHAEMVDAIGDCMVVLILLADLIGTNAEDNLQTAYDVIAKRTGKMVNGQFVKDK